MLVRDADHGAVEHRREGVDDFLDLGWRDVLAAADDQFLEPAGDGQKSVLVALRQIAGVIPAVAQRVACLFRLVVIAGHDVGTAHDQFALLPRRDVVTFSIDDADCKPRYRYAARTQTRVPVGQFMVTMVEVSVMP